MPNFLKRWQNQLLPTMVILMLTTLACNNSDTQGEDPSHDDSNLAEDAVVVATVDGVPITSDRVSRLVEETGSSPREIVEKLIEFELLAAEARRRGLEDAREVNQAGRKAMIQRYIEEEFETTHFVSDIPDAILENAYNQNIRRFKHPRLLKVAHILVVARGKKATKEFRGKAHRLAEKIAGEAKKAATLDEFRDIASRHNKTGGMRVKFESIKTPIHERANLVRPFINAALKLKTIGEVSPAVKTSFGSHVIYVVDIKQPIDRSFDEVQREVAQKEHPFWLQAEFAALVDELRLSAQVKGFVGEKRRSTKR